MLKQCGFQNEGRPQCGRPEAKAIVSDDGGIALHAAAALALAALAFGRFLVCASSGSRLVAAAFAFAALAFTAFAFSCGLVFAAALAFVGSLHFFGGDEAVAVAIMRGEFVVLATVGGSELGAGEFAVLVGVHLGHAARAFCCFGAAA